MHRIQALPNRHPLRGEDTFTPSADPRSYSGDFPDFFPFLTYFHTISLGGDWVTSATHLTHWGVIPWGWVCQQSTWHNLGMGTCQSKERLFAMVANSRAFFISLVFQVLCSFSARKYHQVPSLSCKGLDKSWLWSLLCSILCLDPLRLCCVWEVTHAHHAPSREWSCYFPCNFCIVTYLPSVIFPQCPHWNTLCSHSTTSSVQLAGYHGCKDCRMSQMTSQGSDISVFHFKKIFRIFQELQHSM